MGGLAGSGLIAQDLWTELPQAVGGPGEQCSIFGKDKEVAQVELQKELNSKGQVAHQASVQRFFGLMTFPSQATRR